MKSLPTTPIEQISDQLEQVLPWYANGTLSDADAQWVQAQLAADASQADATESAAQPGPALAAAQAYRFDLAIGNALQARAAEVPADIGWQGLITKVRSDAPARTPAGTSEKRSFGGFLASIFSPRLGMAMAALLAVQTVTIGYLVNQSEQPAYSEYRGAATQVSVLRATFADNVSANQLREVLFDKDLSIIDGPNQLGEYLLQSSAKDLSVLAGELKSAGLITRFSIDQKVISR